MDRRTEEAQHLAEKVGLSLSDGSRNYHRPAWHLLPAFGGEPVFTLSLHLLLGILAMRGAPNTAIEQLAGHMDLSITQRYMHLSPAANRQSFLLARGVTSGNVPTLICASSLPGRRTFAFTDIG